jgi:hypothetical protein
VRANHRPGRRQHPHERPGFLPGLLGAAPGATFADRVKAHRLAAVLTLVGLAERISVPHQRVCDYECGRYAPQWRALVGLVEVLGVGLVSLW